VLGLNRIEPPSLPVGDGAAPDAAPVAEGIDPRDRGTLAHVALERFAPGAAPTTEAIAELAQDLGIAASPAELEDVRGLVTAFAGTPLARRLAGAGAVHREADFSFALEPGGGGPLVSGVLDVLAEEAGGAALVVDYKTDRLHGADPHEVVERDYATQRLVYALAALRGRATRVEVAYCFLEAPDSPVSATYDAADAPALAARLEDIASGVLRERWPVTEDPHRGLCGDCPARPRLCSYDETRTLRDYSTSAASLTGSGGPS
jgi:hypothetical protein